MECLINGQKVDITEYQPDPLVQAVLISLFSWRRSNDDDGVQIPYRHGWWGDTFSTISGDQIGSRLWLLQREKLTRETVALAQAYAEESLQWMIDDALAVQINIEAWRDDGRLNMTIDIVQPGDKRSVEARFQDLWSLVNAIQ